MDSPQLIGSEPPPLWGFRVLMGNSMFELGKGRRRLDVLERETVPRMMGEMDKISANLEKISSQVSKLIILVAVSGAFGSPDLVRGLIGSAHHLSGLDSGYGGNELGMTEMKSSNENGVKPKWR